MTSITKTYIVGVLLLCLSSSIFGANFAIIESSSFHPLQKMDEKWHALITSGGHQATILPQTTLNDISNLDGYDLLIVSSGLIEIPVNRMAVIQQFIESGRNAYIQAEYAVDHPGNLLFKYVVDNLGGNFEWLGAQSGNISPMNVIGPITEFTNLLSNITYFWYGTYGEGDDTVQPILENDGKFWGFVFCTPSPFHGVVLSTSDQDWIRINHSDELLQGLIDFLSNYQALQVSPKVTIELMEDVQCENDMYNFSATVTDYIPEVQLQWTINGNPVDGATGNTFQTSALQEGDVVECLLTLSEFHNYSEMSNPILIAPIFPLETPVMNVAATNPEYCELDPASFLVQIQNDGDVIDASFQWYVNGTAMSGATSNSFTTSGLSSADIITCVYSYEDLCNIENQIESDPISINVAAAETVTAEVFSSLSTACEGTEVIFSATGTFLGDNPSYQWKRNGANIGDNSPSLELSDLQNGQVISCDVTSSLTCVMNPSVTSTAPMVTITPGVTPTIDIVSNVTDICLGSEVTFTAAGAYWGDNPIFEWTIDGIVVGNDSPIFSTTALQPGQLVSCQLIANANCITTSIINSAPVGITIQNPLTPIVSVAANSTQICKGEAITFQAAGIHWGDSPFVQWTINNNIVPGANAAEFTTTELLTGDQISCIISPSENCTTIDNAISEPITITVTEQAIPTIEISADVNGMCSETPITFTATGINWGDSPTIEWQVNGATVGTNASTFTSNTLAAGQLVTGSVISSDLCSSQAAVLSNEVEIFTTSISLQVVESGDETCNNANGYAEVEVIGGIAPFDFTWSNGNNTQWADQLTGGAYQVTVSDVNGCSATTELVIRSLAGPNILSIDVTDAVCEGDYGNAQVTIADNNQDYTIQWVNEDNFLMATGTELHRAPTGQYNVIVSDDYGCSIKEDFFIEQNSSLEVQTLNTQYVVLGEEIDLFVRVNSSSDVQYEWDTLATLSCLDCDTPTATPTENTVYTLTVINESGCSKTVEIPVIVSPEREVFIPNAISPNGDGLNDYFTVYGGNHVARIVSLQVFNRWGATLFAQTDMELNNELVGWNGSHKGKVLKTGVYVYMLEIEFIDGERKTYQGDISILQ